MKPSTEKGKPSGLPADPVGTQKTDKPKKSKREKRLKKELMRLRILVDTMAAVLSSGRKRKVRIRVPEAMTITREQ